MRIENIGNKKYPSYTKICLQNVSYMAVSAAEFAFLTVLREI